MRQLVHHTGRTNPVLIAWAISGPCSGLSQTQIGSG